MNKELFDNAIALIASFDEASVEIGRMQIETQGTDAQKKHAQTHPYVSWLMNGDEDKIDHALGLLFYQDKAMQTRVAGRVIEWFYEWSAGSMGNVQDTKEMLDYIDFLLEWEPYFYCELQGIASDRTWHLSEVSFFCCDKDKSNYTPFFYEDAPNKKYEHWVELSPVRINTNSDCLTTELWDAINTGQEVFLSNKGEAVRVLLSESMDELDVDNQNNKLRIHEKEWISLPF